MKSEKIALMIVIVVAVRMPRRPTSTKAASLLFQRRLFLSFPVFYPSQASIQTQFIHINTRSNVQATKHQEPSKPSGHWNGRPHSKPSPFNVGSPNMRMCSGCGILLQNKDPAAPGFVYRKADNDKDRAKEWKPKLANQIYNAVLEDADKEMVSKLANTDIKVKEMEEEVRQRSSQQDDEEELDIEPRRSFVLHEIDANNIRSRDPSSNKPNLCRRCHEITHHSNPLNHTISHLPSPQSIQSILTQIQSTNPDLTNPPLLIHVLDIVDFPLSFIPFHPPPPNSKVLFVVNRADAICERASSMGHVRAYFKRELPVRLKEAGISLDSFDVLTVSAKKGYGIRELRERIFQLRNAESNVYFIGTPLPPSFRGERFMVGHTNVGKSSIISALLESSGHSKKATMTSEHKNLSPTVSVFPHTTIGFVQIPMNTFKHPRGLESRASLFDTPGVEGDSAFLNSFIDDEYTRAVSLLKVAGFQRPAESMTAGQISQDTSD